MEKHWKHAHKAAHLLAASSIILVTIIGWEITTDKPDALLGSHFSVVQD